MPKNSQKGATLYFAIIIMSLLLAAVFSISSIVLVQIKAIKGMGDSVVAYYAADSGAERALYEGKLFYESVGGVPPAGTEYSDNDLGNNASYKATVLATTSPDCSGQWYCVESKGFYQQTKRGIKVTR